MVRTPSRLAPSPSQIAGPSRRPTLQWKNRDDDQDIPSDDSDTGDRVSQTSRRVRKRKHIPVPRVMNMEVKRAKAEDLAPIPSTTRVSNRIPSYSSPQKTGGQTPNKTTVINRPPTLGSTSLPLNSNSSNMLTKLSSDNMPQSCVDNRLVEQYRWIMFSLWNSTWDFIRKCQCEYSMKQIELEELKRLVMHSLSEAGYLEAGTLQFQQFLENLEVVYVDGDGITRESNGTLLVSGTLCKINDGQPGSTRDSRLLRFSQSIRDVLWSVLSPGDIILLSLSTAHADSPSTCPFVIHLTSKLYDIRNSPTVPANVDSVAEDMVHPNLGVYRAFKFYSFRPSSKTMKRKRLSQTSSGISVIDSDAEMQTVSSTFKYSSDVIISPEQIIEEGATNPVDVLRSQEISFSREDSDDEIVDLCSDEQEPDQFDEGTSIESDAATGAQQLSNFNLEYWMKEGLMVPGSFNSNVKKIDSENSSYQYHKLEELFTMLSNSVQKDFNNPLQKIRDKCHTYGVVVDVDVLQENRHKNAYFVRISDETRASVLLRIHSNSSNIIGPKIKVHQIIRIHRLNVQMEWDSGRSENTMVLSTTPHHNYVLFTQSPNKTFEFFFETCAKTITLEDFDKTRVGELKYAYENKGLYSNDEDSRTVQPDSVMEIGSVEDGITFQENLEHHEVLSRHGDCDLVQHVSEFHMSSGDGCDVEENAACHIRRTTSTMNNSWTDDSVYTANRGAERVCTARAVPDFLDNNPNNESLSCNNVRFTEFKNLQKTDEPINLLCRLVTLGGLPGGNRWKLLVRDLELTVPSAEFQHPDGESDILALIITNARAFEERGLAALLYMYAGTNNLFTIEDIIIKGDNPPYHLEVNGETVRIAKFQDLEKYLNLQDSFSSNPTATSSTARYIPSSISFPKSTSLNATSSALDADSDEESSYYSTKEILSSPTTSQSSVKQISGQSGRVSPLEEWTGKRIFKRKLRHHYLSEEGFQC